MNDAERSKHDRRVRASLVAKLALPLALVALIPSLVGLFIVDGQNDKFSRQAKANAVQAAANKKAAADSARAAATAQATADLLARQVADNKRALRFICSTTGVLDGLVVGVVEQTDKNFEKGPDGLSTYDRLVARGIVTKENVAAARATRSKYEAAHRKLAAPDSPCRGVPGAAKPAG